MPAGIGEHNRVALAIGVEVETLRVAVFAQIGVRLHEGYKVGA